MFIDAIVKPARRTHAERRNESWKKLLDAAVSIIADEGVNALTLEYVGRKGGYSRGLPAKRFGSKYELMLAVVEHLGRRLESRIVEHGMDSMSGLDALFKYIDLYVVDAAFEPEIRAYCMLLSAAVSDASPLMTAFATEHRKVQVRLVHFIQRGIKQGVIRPQVDAEAVAMTVGSLTLGLAMQHLIDPAMDLRKVQTESVASFRASIENHSCRREKLRRS